jgi:hypothetical protein
VTKFITVNVMYLVTPKDPAKHEQSCLLEPKLELSITRMCDQIHSSECHVLITSKASAKLKLLFNKPASGMSKVFNTKSKHDSSLSGLSTSSFHLVIFTYLG